MGRRFTDTHDPWERVRSSLDLQSYSTEELIEALEASAQAANCRALVIIDALNEGRGRDIWFDHLAAFLALLKNSPWIGVILSIRTGYETRIIPQEVFAEAYTIEHPGFFGHEYDALSSFLLVLSY